MMTYKSHYKQTVVQKNQKKKMIFIIVILVILKASTNYLSIDTIKMFILGLDTTVNNVTTAHPGKVSLEIMSV